ncbi:MAG: NAD kinase [Prevotella sp.]|nr:NAD kinase [Prevotella sp.]
MKEPKLRFALFGNEYQTKKSASVELLLEELTRRKAEILMERTFHDFLVSAHLQEGFSAHWAPITVFDELNFPVDYAISMGGDGTLLKTACHVGDTMTPIIGINTGRLGFLADFRPDEIPQALDDLQAGACTIEEHAAISCEAGVALNDIALLKRDTASMITIHARVNGNDLVTYQADGLIVSTPTGSTAYNLSNGGPIMSPGTGILCLTPVAPHSLNIRPIVICDDSEIELTVESRTHNFLVAVDGRSTTFDENTRVTIRKAPYSVRIVKRPAQHYFSTLHKKMMWGADAR